MSTDFSAAPMLEPAMLLEDQIQRRPGPSTDRIFGILGAYHEAAPTQHALEETCAEAPLTHPRDLAGLPAPPRDRRDIAIDVQPREG